MKSTQHSAISTQPIKKRVVLMPERLLLREALSEAISSVESFLDSNLPPDKKNFTAREKELHSKWTTRCAAYKALLKKLGGKVPCCWEDFA